MSEPTRPDDTDLFRALSQHLESLRSAGVEWLPTSAAPPRVEPAPVAQSVPAATEPAGETWLFPEDGGALPTAVVTPEQRRIELNVLAETVSHCTRCPELTSTRRQTVFGVGPLDAQLCFLGEAPGADEDRQGEPFVGAAGQLLNRIIAACGLKREEVYICNILRCRPPGNRQPLPNEAHNCREYLDKQLELVRPKFICCLGACAAQNLLNTTTGIGRLRGRFYDYRGIPVRCTFHPAALLRDPTKKRDVWEDMKQLLERMGRPVPGK